MGQNVQTWCLAGWNFTGQRFGKCSTKSNLRIQNVDKGVSKNRGTPKWMVYNGSKPYEQMG